MPDPLPFEIIKPEVRSVSAYTLKHFEAAVKLDQNESPYEVSEDLKEELMRRVLRWDWRRYPEFVPRRTLERLATFTGWREDGILVGNGSNELIYVALIATLCPGRTVTIPQPTFALYKLMATILGATVRDVFLRESDLSFDVEGLVGAARTSDVVLICSPNSPTGTLLDRNDAERIVGEARGLVIIDEAYHEFSRQTYFPLLERFENLVLLRTFSKARALAGLRFGYMLAHPRIAVELQKVKLPYSVNIFTLAAAELALERSIESEQWVQAVIAERERVRGELLRRSRLEIFPSQGNFILARTPYPASALFEALYAEGVLVRDVSSYPLLDRALRVSIGTPAENDRFLECLDRSLERLQ